MGKHSRHNHSHSRRKKAEHESRKHKSKCHSKKRRRNSEGSEEDHSANKRMRIEQRPGPDKSASGTNRRVDGKDRLGRNISIPFQMSELEVLTTEAKDHEQVLLLDKSTAVSRAKRKSKWDEIASKVSAAKGIMRSAKTCESKICRLKSELKEEERLRKKFESMTGGGSAAWVRKQVEKVKGKEMMEDDLRSLVLPLLTKAQITGVPLGIDTSIPATITKALQKPKSRPPFQLSDEEENTTDCLFINDLGLDEATVEELQKSPKTPSLSPGSLSPQLSSSSKSCEQAFLSGTGRSSQSHPRSGCSATRRAHLNPFCDPNFMKNWSSEKASAQSSTVAGPSCSNWGQNEELQKDELRRCSDIDSWLYGSDL